MFDFITDFLISIDPMISIMLISAFASLLSTVVIKFTSDQKRLKELKEKQKTHQAKIKDLQKQGKQSEMLLEQQEMMKATQESFKHTMKPMLFTMIPLLFIFGWLNAHSVFIEIQPNEEFPVYAFFDESGMNASLSAPDNFEFISNNNQVIKQIELTKDAKKNLIDKNRELSKLKRYDVFNLAIWKLKSNSEGKYILELNYKNKTYSKEILISSERRYINPVKVFDEENTNGLKAIVIGNQRILFNFLGLTFGWLGLYILSSIVFGNILRKLLKVA